MSTTALQDLRTNTAAGELEVLVFTVGELTCGVNVAKVREVIAHMDPIHVPRAHPAVAGVANLRGQVIPLVDLQLYFYPGQASQCPQRNVVVTEFSNLLMGFIVDGVEQIFRLSWDQVEPAPSQHAATNAAVTSICRVNERLVLMIDFDKIIFDLQGVPAVAERPASAAGSVDRAAQRLLLVEDSPTTRGFVQQTLTRAGYTNVTVVNDGQYAWDVLQQVVWKQVAPFDLIVTDVEMPRMDGLELCKRLKADPHFKDTPVVIFSSLVSAAHEAKMAATGANATVTKPQLPQLVEIVDGLLVPVTA